LFSTIYIKVFIRFHLTVKGHLKAVFNGLVKAANSGHNKQEVVRAKHPVIIWWRGEQIRAIRICCRGYESQIYEVTLGIRKKITIIYLNVTEYVLG